MTNLHPICKKTSFGLLGIFMWSLFGCSHQHRFLKSNYAKFLDQVSSDNQPNDPSSQIFISDKERLESVSTNFTLACPEIDFSVLTENYTPVSAQEYLLKRAGETEILILNEAHHYPSHRIFARNLLAGLWAQGYRYLGLEALTMVADFKQPNYPLSSLGYYCNEPMFGHFIREAIRLGFILFPYESSKHGKEREIEQATNIANFLKENTVGKTFIYCGYSHNNECEMPEWEKAMAGRLKELTGINPLTVDQTSFNGISEIPLNESVVFIDSLKQSFLNSACIDIYVFHPTISFKEEKSIWKTGLTSQCVKVDFLPKQVTYPVLVFCFNSRKEFKNGVPFDCVEVLNETENEWIYTPENQEFMLYAVDKNKKSIPLKL
jgi:hypothetical protein